MSDIARDVLLGLAIAAAWIAALGFLRMRWSLDRLHACAFVIVACGLPFVIAGFVVDGPSVRAFKLLLLWFVMLVAGASLNQAIARAIFTRKEESEMH